MARRSNDDQNFFEELKASGINLPVAVQDELAAMVSRAYSSQTLGVPRNQIGGLPISHPLIDQYLPGVTTMSGLEGALNQSIITPLIGMTQRIVENKGSADPSAIFSDLYAGALNAAQTYQPTYKGRPATFQHFAQRTAFQAASGENRKEWRNTSIDEFVNNDGDLLPSAPSSLTVNDTQLDAWLDEAAGIKSHTPSVPVAPYNTPKKRWYEPLTKVNSPIPSPFYAPEGQSFLVDGGLNPNLKFKPGAGLSQVSIQPNELRSYVRDVATDADTFREQPKPVRSFLKQTAEGLRGGGFISTDEELLGNVAGLDNAFAANTSEGKFNYTGINIDREALWNRGASPSSGSALRNFYDARTEILSNPEHRKVPAFQAQLRGQHAPVVQGLVSTIRELAPKDPATAAAMYLKSAGTYGLGPADIRGIGVNTGDKSFGDYVSNNFEDLTEALKSQEGAGYFGSNPEDLSEVVTALRAEHPKAIQSGEIMAEGVMKGVRLEDTATYNKGRDAVRRATATAEQAQRARMGLSDPVQAPVDNAPAVPEPDVPGRSFGRYSQAPEEPPMPADWTTEKPVSDVRNPATAATVQQADLDKPASTQTVKRATKDTVSLQSQAVRAREMLTGNKEFQAGYGSWVGKGPESEGAFREWLGDVVGPNAPAAWDTLMQEKAHRAASGIGGRSEFSNMIASRPQWSEAHNRAQQARAQTENNGGAGEPASSSVSAASSDTAPPPSSNGSRGGGGNQPPTTTSTPVDMPEPQSGRSDAEWSAQLEQEVGPTPNRITEAQAQVARDTIGDVRQSDIHNRIRNVPLSNRETQQLVEATRTQMSSVGAQGVYASGSYHGVYGLYKQADPDDPSKGGSFRSLDSGLQTVSNTTIQQGKSIYDSALSQAFDKGGFEGLSNREFAATVHKRVQEGIQRIVNDKVEEMVKASPESATEAKALGQQLRTVAGDMLSQGDAKLRETSDSSRIGDTNMSSIRAHGKSLKPLYEAGGDLKERVDELGGLSDVMNGPRRVLVAGDQSYEVGEGGGSGGGGWQDKIKSIYSSNFGHAMMAQFMASMAWKSTGGAVMESANQWATQQYGYAGIDNFGGGALGPGVMATARQEMFANRSGSLAYQQYGFLSELGYVAGNMPGGENLLRAGNDLKMAAGTAAVAGVGTWGIGAMFGSTALAGAALPVAATAGALVGLPSLGMTAFNAANDLDSYSGASWKNLAARSVLGQAAMEDQGFFRSFGLSTKFTGQGQEEWAQEHTGMSARDFVSKSKIADFIGQENVNWLFEGREQKDVDARDLVHDLQKSTGLKEDVLQKQVAAMQVAFGGLDTKEQRDAATIIGNQAADQGVDATEILSRASGVASQRGILTGTAEFQELAVSFAKMSPVDQQKEILKSSRAAQLYSQFSPYLEGGMAEAYSLHSQYDISTPAQAQAIQSMFSQASMGGVNLTPQVAQELTGTAMSMKPFQAIDVAQMSSNLFQMGAGSFEGNFSAFAGAMSKGQFGFSLSDAGNLATGSFGANGKGNPNDTLAFLKGVAGGNAYALSDYGRMAGIGVLQSMDANGLQTGLKDMSGLLSFANQNVLQTPGATGAQTLAGLGMSFNYSSSSSLLGGGIWGYQASYMNQTNALQRQGLNLQFDALADNREFTYRGWGIETQMTNTQWDAQQRNFAFQGNMMDVRMRHAQEDAGAAQEGMTASQENNRWMRDFDYQTSLMRRDYSREDFQFQTQMRSLNFGWGMEDVNEQIRRSSGYERSLLIRQRDRMTTSENMQSGQADRQMERSEEMWAREDERYQKSLAFSEQMMDLEQENFNRNLAQQQELYEMNKAHLNDEIATATELHSLRMEMEVLQRARQQEDMNRQEASLRIQRQMQELQNEYANNMRIISNTQNEMEASLRKITQYQPAFSRMLTEFLSFLQESTTRPVTSSVSGGGTVRR